MEHLTAMQEKFSDGLIIISINCNLSETVEELKTYREELNVTWKIARDTEYVYWYKYGEIKRVPAIILIDPNGFIQYRHDEGGIVDESVLSGRLAEIPEFSITIIPVVFVILLLFLVSSRRILSTKRTSLESHTL